MQLNTLETEMYLHIHENLKLGKYISCSTKSKMSQTVLLLC